MNLLEKNFTSNVEENRLSSEEFKDTKGQSIYPSQIWRDGQLIPSSAPVFTTYDTISSEAGDYKQAIYSIEYASRIVSILKKYVKLPLIRVKGTDNCFYNDGLVDTIPYNFDNVNHSYTWQIFVNGQEKALDYGVGNASIDLASGVLSFDESFVKKEPINTVAITSFQYVGRKGFFGMTLNEDLPFADSESLLHKEDDPTKEASLKVRGDVGVNTYILPPVKSSFFEKDTTEEEFGVIVLQETLNAVIDKNGIIDGGIYL